MSGALPPLTQYVSMAWCSVKALGQIYLLHTVVKNKGTCDVRNKPNDNNRKCHTQDAIY